LASGVRDKIREEKKAKLSAEEREAIGTAAEARDQDEYMRAMAAENKILVTHREVAARVKGAEAERAKKLAAEIELAERMASAISRDRHTINFNYWRTRCLMEKTESALEARRLLYTAAQLSEEAALPQAREAYEKGFVEWRKTFDEFPTMVNNSIGADTLADAVKGYGLVLNRLEAPFPEDFVLQDFLDAYRSQNPSVRLPGLPEPEIPPPGNPPGA